MNIELYHHGIKGQKWGVRRYQNADGSLTPKGKNRYYQEADAEGYDKESYSGGRYKVTKSGKVERYYADPNRWVKDDIKNSKSAIDDASKMVNSIKNFNNSHYKSKPKARMDLSSMSDKEMREKINRELLERQYDDMFAPKNQSKGKAYVDKTLAVAGTVLTTASTALSIALAIKELKG